MELALDHPRADTAIVASRRQQQNPMIREIRDVPVVYADILPDFLVAPKNAVLFISLKYHRLHKNYLETRIQGLKARKPDYQLKIVLAVVDLPDFESPLEQVTLLTFGSGFSLFLAWSGQEAAKTLESFKALADKPPDLILGRPGDTHFARVSSLLTSIPSVNKTDAITLMTKYNSLREVILAEEAELKDCPGIGDKKRRKIQKTFCTNFFE